MYWRTRLCWEGPDQLRGGLAQGCLRWMAQCGSLMSEFSWVTHGGASCASNYLVRHVSFFGRYRGLCFEALREIGYTQLLAGSPKAVRSRGSRRFAYIRYSDGMTDSEAQRDVWTRDPRKAARAWLSASEGPGYADHSIAQYAAMIGTAADWLDEHAGQTLWQAQARDIDRFLRTLSGRGGRPASASTVKRYVATLNMLFTHLQQVGVRQGNPMDGLRPAAARQGSTRQAPRFLTVEQAETYQLWVLRQPSMHWCDKRDAALRAIYLACGITVEESLALSWRDLRLKDRPAQVRVRARSAAQDRRIPLPGWSLPVLTDWLDCRVALPVLGDTLFLARKRSPTVELDGGEPLASAISTSEIYDIVRPAMEAAGMDDEQLGPQTLRNSYAVRQLSQGVETAVLQKWMGLRTAFSIDAIRRELSSDGGITPI